MVRKVRSVGLKKAKSEATKTSSRKSPRLPWGSYSRSSPNNFWSERMWVAPTILTGQSGNSRATNSGAPCRSGRAEGGVEPGSRLMLAM